MSEVLVCRTCFGLYQDEYKVVSLRQQIGLSLNHKNIELSPSPNCVEDVVKTVLPELVS